MKDNKLLNVGFKSTVNHDDTMRKKLLQATFEYLRHLGHAISPENEVRIANYLLIAEPPFFKELADRGVAAKGPVFVTEFKVKLNALQLIVIGSLYAKFPTVGDKNVTRNAALQTYISSELEVRDFNNDHLASLIKSPIFSRVRRTMRSYFANFEAKDLVDEVRFGPGSTSTIGSKKLTEKLAWVSRSNGVVLPNDLYDYFESRGLASKLAIATSCLNSKIANLGSRPQANPKMHRSYAEFEEVISTVPKNAQTDRTISTYPIGVTLISVTTNSYLRSIIHNADARIEFVHQEQSSGYLDDYLKTGGKWNETATLDLQDASGHVSWELIRHVIDNSDVLELLTASRAKESLLSVFVKKIDVPLIPLIEKGTYVPEGLSASMRYSLFHNVVEGRVEESDVEIFNRAVNEHEWLKTLATSDIAFTYAIVRESKGFRVLVSFERFSHAGMGSGATFPIMAALIAAIVKESGVSTFRVYGDDIVLISTIPSEVESVIRNLELFGLKVNRKKSCYGSSSVREAVGSWWYVNQASLVENFVPFYLRKDLNALVNLKSKDEQKSQTGNPDKTGSTDKRKQKCKDLRILHYAVNVANYLRQMQHPGSVVLTKWLLSNSAVPISWVSINSGLFGLQVPDDQLWDHYEPVFKEGILVSLRKRLVIDCQSYTDGSITVERFETKADVDLDLHYMYIKVKGIQVVPFDKETPGAFVDSDIRPFTSSFVLDPLANALGRLRADVTFGEFVEWVKLANEVVRQCEDRKVSDRPEKDDQIYFQSTQVLSIPEDVIRSWETKLLPLELGSK